MVILKTLYIIPYIFRIGSLSRDFSGKTESPLPVIHGDWMALPETVRSWTHDQIKLCQPGTYYMIYRSHITSM